MRTSFFVFMYLVALNVISQKRCYTYDAAGNRALRDLACDVACSNLVSNTNDAGSGSLRKAVQCATAGQTVNFATFMQNEDLNIITSPILVDQAITITQTPSQVTLKSLQSVFNVIANGAIFQNLQFNCPCIPGLPALAIQNSGTLTLANVTIESDNTGLCTQNFIRNTGKITITGLTKLIKP